MHKYNQKDQRLMFAMLDENINAGRKLYDFWNLNQDTEYNGHRQRGVEEGGRLVLQVMGKWLFFRCFDL